jgi:hypothetical protein
MTRALAGLILAALLAACGSDPVGPDCPTIRAEVATLRANAATLRLAAASTRNLQPPAGDAAALAMLDAADAIDQLAAAKAVPQCGPYEVAR